jgi:hypothetical protein
MNENLEIVKALHKTDLRQLKGYDCLKTFNRHLKILATEPLCPFTWDDYKKCGHYVKGLWVKYIIENL